MSLNLGGMQSLSLMMGGIDYSQIVQQLAQADRAPGDALNQVIQTEQLKQNDWQTMQGLATKVQNDLVQMSSSSTFTAATAAVSGTNATDFTASVSGNAVSGVYKVTVLTPASNATVQSGSQIGNSANINSTAVNAAAWSQPIPVNTTLSVAIGNTTNSYTIKSGDTLNSVLTALFPTGSGVTWTQTGDKVNITNNSGNAVTFGSAGDTSNLFAAIGLAGQVVQNGTSATSLLLGHAQLTQSLNGGNFATALAASGAGTMSINGVSINYNTTTDTLQSVMNAINASSAGVTAAYDSISDTVKLTSKTSQPISIQDTTNNLGKVLGLTSTSTVAPVTVNGTPMQYSINGGQTLTSASSTVTGVIPGVTFTSNATTANETATITVAQDPTVLTKNVNAFIGDFNNLYHQLQQYTQKGGDLQGDEAMAQLGFKYMSDVLGVVQTTTQYPQNTVMGIGISNGAVGSAPGNTNSLQVDTNALTNVFQNNPSEVQALIQGMSSKLNQDLVSLTGQFNTLFPLTTANMNLKGIAQSQQDMYATIVTQTENQQQRIYDLANQQAQILQTQFSQLQQFQQTSSMQQNVLKGMFGIG